MARIRYLKPDFFKDEDLVEHPHWIRLLFQGLWTMADKEGRLEDRPKRIKAELFPYENTDIEKGLNELAKVKNHSTRPFIQRYEVSGEKYIQIVNWHKHQKPHHTEKDSIIPPTPPNINIKGMEKQDEASPALNNGDLTVKEPKNTITNTSIEIYDYYAKTIKAGAKEDAIKNITTLLKQGVKKEDLVGRINAYKLQLIKDKTDTQYYIQANNFFGKKARYKDFEPKAEPKLKPADKNCKLCKGTGFAYIPEQSANVICNCRKVKDK